MPTPSALYASMRFRSSSIGSVPWKWNSTPNLPVGLGRCEVGGALDEGEPRVRIDGADPIAQNAKGGACAVEDPDGGAGRSGAAFDPPVDVLAAQHEGTDRIDHNGFVVNALVIQRGHARILPLLRLSRIRGRAPHFQTCRATRAKFSPRMPRTSASA